MADALTPTPRYRRILRIAWTVGWGILTVLLCVLWVRSYWRWEGLSGALPNGDRFNLATVWGRVRFATLDIDYSNSFTGERLEGWNSHKIVGPQNLAIVNTPLNHFGFGFAGSKDTYGVVVVVPIAFLTTLAATLAAASWMRWSNRFSLRTLLILTTLLSVFLGFVVWMMS